MEGWTLDLGLLLAGTTTLQPPVILRDPSTYSEFPEVLLQSVDPIAFGSVEKQDVMVAWTALFMAAGRTERNEKDTLH